jgi:hypothetical protein
MVNFAPACAGVDNRPRAFDQIGERRIAAG